MAKGGEMGTDRVKYLHVGGTGYQVAINFRRRRRRRHSECLPYNQHTDNDSDSAIGTRPLLQ